MTGREEIPDGAGSPEDGGSPQEGAPQDGGMPEEVEAFEPEDFDSSAFDAAFAEAFGEAVEPERTFRSSAEGSAHEGAIDGASGESEARVGVSESEDSGTSDESAEPAADQPAPRRVVAVVLTPIASAPALAGLCAIAKLDADIVPTRSGALAVRVIETAADDPSELLGGDPAEAVELAGTLSRTAKAGVVLLTARLGQGDEGLTGTISGRQFTAGEAGDEVAAGLILAHADDVVEQILLGMLQPQDAPGRLAPKELGRWQAARMLGKATRKKRP
ncbi:hypothetical protein [Ruania halotolerans]|uniref:hypothetical protein n=1 Tax=Ruania halotolerans TaxID=2897773 RepID=UPI001E65832B|nr:hypothetical protein [Ruania halotolerans]UFU05103.1 hypothetical protein LQF10_11530 [Ruania halotolerans]